MILILLEIKANKHIFLNAKHLYKNKTKQSKKKVSEKSGDGILTSNFDLL